MAKKRKYFLFFLLLSIITVLIINYRTPFMIKKSLGWSIAFSSSEELNNESIINNSKIISRKEFTKLDSYWNIVDTLIANVRLKDPMIYLSDSTNLLLASDDNMQLHLYESNSLFSGWKPHSKKIISMGTESRGGGRIFKMNDKILVPLQNSTKGYGYGVSLYSLNKKKEEYFLKKEVPLIISGIDSIKEFSFGMHHIDVQNINNIFYYLVDGNETTDENKVNFYGPIKWNLYDLKNFILN